MDKQIFLNNVLSYVRFFNGFVFVSDYYVYLCIYKTWFLNRGLIHHRKLNALNTAPDLAILVFNACSFRLESIYYLEFGMLKLIVDYVHV